MAVTTITLSQLINDMITTQIQEIEDAGYEVYGNLDIDNSEVQQLLNIAELVGQGKLTTNNLSELRAYIKAKIYANVSKGNHDDVYRTAEAITFANNIILTELYPAAITVYTDGTVPANVANYALKVIDEALAAGVGVFTIVPIYGDGMFWLAPDTGAIYSNTELSVGLLGEAIVEKEV